MAKVYVHVIWISSFEFKTFTKPFAMVQKFLYTSKYANLNLLQKCNLIQIKVIAFNNIWKNENLWPHGNSIKSIRTKSVPYMIISQYLNSGFLGLKDWKAYQSLEKLNTRAEILDLYILNFFLGYGHHSRQTISVSFTSFHKKDQLQSVYINFLHKYTHNIEQFIFKVVIYLLHPFMTFH